MSPEEADRYSEYWREQGIGSDNTWKDDCGKVVTYRVKDGVELTCPAGPIGP